MAIVAGDGSEKLAALAVRLKEVQPELMKELRAGIRVAAAPCVDAAKAAALAKLPHRGGLNAVVAKRPIRVSTRTPAAKAAGVRLQSTSQHGNKETDEGHVRHPVFGRKTSLANGTTKSGKAKTKAFYVDMTGGGYGDDLGYGGNVKANWVDESIPGAAGWWSETLAASAPLVTPAIEAAMETISNKIQGGI